MLRAAKTILQKKEENSWGSRKENRHTDSSRNTRYVYFTSFDLVTTEGKTINVKFTDSRKNSEFYAPVVKFCKDKGTSAAYEPLPAHRYH